MTKFSPIDAALEGLRVVRREPWAVAYWVAVWSAAFILIAVVERMTGLPARVQASPDDLQAAIRRFGPLGLLLASVVLVLWVMTTATVYRAVLRPDEHGWHLLKLGPDEARIGILSAAETFIAAVLGGVPAYLLLVLLNPIFEMAPSLNRLTAFGGFVATMLIDIWIAVRLSLAPVQTFAQHRFPLSAYWAFARGHYWRLLLGYLIVVVELLVVIVVLTVLIGGGLWEISKGQINLHDLSLLHRTLLLALAAMTAVLAAVACVAPAILINGYQAYAYRAIAGSPPDQAAAAAPV
jgi:hypothetical protein